jgi:hypothetical protein
MASSEGLFWGATLSIIISFGNRGLPPREFQRQKSWKALRCQLVKISGFTLIRAFFQCKSVPKTSIESLAESSNRRCFELETARMIVIISFGSVFAHECLCC